jgi:hypothetical protein
MTWRDVTKLASSVVDREEQVLVSIIAYYDFLSHSAILFWLCISHVVCNLINLHPFFIFHRLLIAESSLIFIVCSLLTDKQRTSSAI